MPQVLKKEVRDRIVAAALEVFAARGYAATTMSAIAERAGLGTASLYRYYPAKAELFEAAIPTALVEQFEELLTRRVRTLGASLHATDPSSEEMLRFWIDHRLQVVILLDRAHGTPHARFGEQFVDILVRLTMEQLASMHSGISIDRPTEFVLQRIFENTRRMLASILEAHDQECEIRRAIRAFWAYQIAGLRGLSEHLSAPGGEHRRA